jgi:hypothetical protein
VVLMFVAAELLWKNMPHGGDDAVGIHRRLYGWPLPFYETSGWGYFGILEFDTMHWGRFSACLGTCALILCIVAVVLEWLIRRRERQHD